MQISRFQWTEIKAIAWWRHNVWLQVGYYSYIYTYINFIFPRIHVFNVNQVIKVE